MIHLNEKKPFSRDTNGWAAGWARAFAIRMLHYRLALFVCVTIVVPNCAPGFDPPSKINTLRVLAVTVDKPYVAPGSEATFHLTLYDGLGGADNGTDNGEAEPRDVQILWLGGCFNPDGDQFFLCFEQLASLLAPLADGGTERSTEAGSFVKIELGAAQASGIPDIHAYTLKVPADIITRRPPPSNGPHYGIAYVFFAVCAGRLAPADLSSPGGGEVSDFPLDCFDSDGKKLGSESFVIGYTQIYAFADGRENGNPSVTDLTLDGVPISNDLTEATVVARCPVSNAARQEQGCSQEKTTDDCMSYKLDVQVGGVTANDVAEVDPYSLGVDGKPQKESVWVSYFGNGGDLSPSLALVSDALKGAIDDHSTEWIPPAEPGFYSIWAVLRDQRGGSSVIRRIVQVR